jgi:hypothetical protein
MSYAKDLIEQFDSWISMVELDSRNLREKNERLEAENEYLKKQVDVLLKVLGREQHGNKD